MAHVLGDRVLETTVTTGTGTITLAGAISGYRAFSAVATADGDTFYYSIAGGSEWENGLGTRASATTFARTKILSSSNAGAAVNFSAGTKEVWMDAPAAFLGTITGRNRIINGRFQVDQRNIGVATATADAAYCADRWKLLGEFTCTVTARDITIGGGRFNGKISLTQANNKAGFWQAIEGINCKDLRGKTVTLSAVLQVSNARVGNIKMAIVEWTGTEDAPTADPISAWGADGITPTLAASFAFINTPANLSVGTSAARFQVSATLGSTFTNLAVFIWNDDKSFDAADLFYVTDVQLEEFAVATPFEFRSHGHEQALCQRYYYKRRSLSASFHIGIAQAYGTTTCFGLSFPLPVTMRAAPTVTLSSVAHLAAYNATAGASDDFAAVTFDSSVDAIVTNDMTGSASLVAGNATIIKWISASGAIEASADL